MQLAEFASVDCFVHVLCAVVVMICGGGCASRAYAFTPACWLHMPFVAAAQQSLWHACALWIRIQIAEHFGVWLLADSAFVDWFVHVLCAVVMICGADVRAGCMPSPLHVGCTCFFVAAAQQSMWHACALWIRIQIAEHFGGLAACRFCFC